MLKQRVITAVVCGLLFLSMVLWASSSVFKLFIIAVMTLGAWEWADLSGLSHPLSRATYCVVLVAVASVLVFIPHLVPMLSVQGFLGAIGIWWAIALLWVQSYPGSVVFWRTRAIRLVLGVLVLVPTTLALTVLRDMAQGFWLVIAIVLLVAAADIGAYFTGRAFGKHKLAPAVSPGKSWEGVLGGILTAVIIMNLFLWFLGEPNFAIATLLAIPTALISVVGDLFESMLKRHRGIKDSGKLLPGHGGILDRIDGLVAAAPIFALVVLGSGWRL